FFLKTNDYINSINMENVNLVYISNFVLPIINGMNGSAKYTDDDKISIVLQGKFLNSVNNNIFLNGIIDNAEYTAELDLNFENDEFSDFKSPFGIYKIKKGNYSGVAKLEINKFSKEKLYLSGNFNLKDLDIIFNNKIFLEKTGLDLSYFNGVVSLNDFNGRLNGLPFNGQGKVFNLLYPNGDIFLDFEKISGSGIIKALNIAGLDKSLYENIQIGDDNSLNLHLTNDFLKPTVNYNLRISSLVYNKTAVSDIKIGGCYNSEEIVLTEANMFAMNNIVKMNGKLYGIFSNSPKYSLDIKSTGALFSNFPIVSSEYLRNQSTIIEGNIYGKIGELPRMKATLSSFDFKNKDSQKTFTCDLSFANNKFKCTVFDISSNSVLHGNYNIKEKEYNISGSDIMNFYELLFGYKLFENEKNLFFELFGNDEFLNLKTGSKDEKSLFYGDLDAKFDLNKDILESFVNWMPREKNILSRPANFRLKKTDALLSISDIFFDSKEISGMASLNIKDKAISGELEAQNMDFGKFFAVPGLSTNTDLFLKLKGSLSAPYIDIFINENILKYYDSQKDSLIISGEAQAHLENKKLRLEKIIVYEGLQKIVTLAGNIKDFKSVDLSAYGEIKAEFFNVFFEKIKLTGDMEYKIDLTGKINDIRLKNSDITINNGSINGDIIRKFTFKTAEFDSTGVMVQKLLVDAGKYLNLNAEGFIPYDDESEIYVTGDFYGDFISYFDKKTKLISKGSSECEGKFTIEGRYKKPKIKEIELYILDGKFTPQGSYDGFDKIRSKMFIDENSNLDIVKFIMHSAYTNGKISITNGRSDKSYGDIIIPGGINLGHLSLIFSERGIDYHAFRMMLPKDYGNFVLKGKNDDEFRIYKRNGNLVLEGKVFLRNSRITYPFLKPELKDSDSKGSKYDISKSLFSGLELDIEVLPAGGNTYFFNLDSEEKSIWDRFVRSFSRLDNELNNVSINITPSQKGLIIKGPVEKGHEIRILGNVSGKNGTCNYSAFSFKIDNVSIRFDGQTNESGYTDPYLKASAKTTVKTKTDSTGLSGYETVYLKIVTKEDEQIVDSEGARISNLAIILTDEYGNVWLDSEDKLSEIDTKGTVKQMFNEAVDTKLLSPIISPIESALGRFLGAQVSIRPNLSGNFMNNELGILEIPENYAEYFVGSEFYISKFFTDDLALTWNSKYIGSEEYSEKTERDYGYKNSLSFDYRLNNYIFSSAGYQYDSINDEYGYNVALSYRYRFMNISEPYYYIKNLLYKMRK
ncbi:MAG: translocation/assembly module TamB, partial [Candidatus Delongbacteria bacterium]|nr:translocation/assembly module TamB [Candidatus Delongbacteria bacterium]